jgi:hypothetical protein
LPELKLRSATAGDQAQSEDQNQEQPSRVALPRSGLADSAAATALRVDVATVVTTTFARRRSGVATSRLVAGGRGVALAASSRTTSSARTATATSATLTVFTVRDVEGAGVGAGDAAEVEAFGQAGLAVHLVAVALFAVVDVAIAAGDEVGARDDRAAEDFDVDGEARGEIPLGAVDVDVQAGLGRHVLEVGQVFGDAESRLRRVEPDGRTNRTQRTHLDVAETHVILGVVGDDLQVIDAVRHRDRGGRSKVLNRDVQLTARASVQKNFGGEGRAGRGVVQEALSAGVEDHLGLQGVDADDRAVAQLNQDAAGAAVLLAGNRVFTQLNLASTVSAAATAILRAAGAGFSVMAGAVSTGGGRRAGGGVELAGIVASEIPTDEAEIDVDAGLAIQIRTITDLFVVDVSIAAAGTAVPGAIRAVFRAVAGPVPTGGGDAAAGGVEAAGAAGQRSRRASSHYRSAGLAVEVRAVAVFTSVNVAVAAGDTASAVLRTGTAGFDAVAGAVPTGGGRRAGVGVELAGIAGQRSRRASSQHRSAGLAVEVRAVAVLASVDCSVAAARTAVRRARGAGFTTVAAGAVPTGGGQAAGGGVELAGDGIAAQRAGVIRQEGAAGLEVEVGPGAELAFEPVGSGVALFSGGVGQESISADAVVLGPHGAAVACARVEVVARQRIDRAFELTARSVDRSVVGEVVEVVLRAETGGPVPAEELVVDRSESGCPSRGEIEPPVDWTASDASSSATRDSDRSAISRIEHVYHAGVRSIADVQMPISSKGNRCPCRLESRNECAIGGGQTISIDVALLELTRSTISHVDLPSTDAAGRADEGAGVGVGGLDATGEVVEGPVVAAVDRSQTGCVLRTGGAGSIAGTVEDDDVLVRPGLVEHLGNTEEARVQLDRSGTGAGVGRPGDTENDQGAEQRPELLDIGHSDFS